MADDDLLDDISGVDFGYGYDDALGDPNVKPRPPPAPQEDPAQRKLDSLGFTFPKQNQFLTKLVLQVTPVTVPAPASGKGGAPYDPFSSFSRSAPDNREVVITTDAPNCTSATVTGLASGTYYAARLLVTNPSGTAVGARSQPILTPPAPPPAPVCSRATTSSADVNFPAQGQYLEKLVIEVMMDMGTGEPPFTRGRAFAAQIATAATAIGVSIANLEAGKRYFARLRSFNPAGSAVGPASEGFVTLPEIIGLGEDHSQRTSHQVVLKFEPIASYLSELSVEYVQVSGDAKPQWNKAESKKVPEPTSATTVTVGKLQGSIMYAFRLRGVNPAGVAYSDVLKVETVGKLQESKGWGKKTDYL